MSSIDNEMQRVRKPTLIYFIRSIHALLAMFFILCLAYIYYCGIGGKVSSLAWAAVGVMIVEGLAIWLNGGLCPLTSLQHKLGDDKGFFDLFLPPKLLPHVVPFFVATTTVGVILLLIR